MSRMRKDPDGQGVGYHKLALVENDCSNAPTEPLGVPRESLRAALLTLDDRDILWVLRSLDRPDLVKKSLNTPTPQETSVRVIEKKEEPVVKGPNTRGLSPVVQFSAPIFYVLEDEGYITIDIIRIGDLSRVSQVKYKTRPASALAGVHFDSTEGVSQFEPGSNEASFTVHLVVSDAWNTTVEFQLELLEEGRTNCEIGRYLGTARVKICDKDVFPTSRFKNEILAKELYTVSHWQLLHEYFKMNWNNPEVRKRTVKSLLSDQLHNLIKMIKTFAQVYLVDYIINSDVPPDELFLIKDRRLSLIILVLIELCFFLVMHLFDFLKVTYYSVIGPSVAMLQTALYRKYLNYSEASRNELISVSKSGDLTMAIVRDTQILVEKGYGSILKASLSIGQLILILVFQVSAPYVFGRPFRWIALIPNFIYPPLMLGFLITREKKTTRVLDAHNDSQDEMVSQVGQTERVYRVIADFNRRPFFADKFEARATALKKATVAQAQLLCNNTAYSQWLTFCMVAIYTVVGGLQCIQTGETIGMYMAQVQNVAALGKAWGIMYTVLLDMQEAFPALDNLVSLLNLATDVPLRQKLNLRRREITKKTRQLIRQELGDNAGGPPPIDMLTIKVEDVDVKPCMESNEWQTLRGPLNHCGRLEVSQGKLIGLFGPLGEGKGTLLRILGDVVLPNPEDGVCFVPSHLRVLHVTTPPLFFKATFMDSITFGVTKGHPDGRLDRVVKICQRIGLNLPENLKLLSSEQEYDWLTVFSETERQLFSIARALVANPEVMCIHKPIDILTSNRANQVIEVLREFVDKRGIEQDPGMFHYRRPRTCFATTAKLEGCDKYHEVYHISREKGVVKTTPENLPTTIG